MGLGFLVPAFLIGLAALAIPLLLHLRHRDKDRPYRFPSLMFLEQLPIRTSQRQRITDWPLLLLRALALALLALAFARPVFTTRVAATTDSRSRAVVLVLDRSLSMSHVALWPAALDSARAIIRSLEPNDRVGVVLFDDAAEVAQRLTDDKAAALAALGSATPVARGTRFAPALRTARQLLLDAPFAAAEIVLISDLQRAGTLGMAGLDLPTGVGLRAVAVVPPMRANSAIRAVEARRVQTAQGNGRSMLAVKARIVSRELGAPRSILASLTLSGRSAGTQQVTLVADGETVVTFAPVAAPDGPVDGLVSLEADALAMDDRFAFVVPRDDLLRVLLVLPNDGGGEEPLFFERALAIGRAPEIRIVRSRQASLSPAMLPQHDVAFFWDNAPSDAATPMLSDFTTKGGGVVQLVGRRMAAQGTPSPLLPAKVRGMADRFSNRNSALRDIRLDHPIFTPFRTLDDPFASTRLFQYPRLDAPRDADLLARFEDGLPALLEKRLGNGRVLLLAIPLDVQQGDFPLQPAFLPFLRQLLTHSAGRDAMPLWRSTAENWTLPDSLSDPVVRTPSGALVRPAGDSLGRAVPLADAGIYAAFSGSVTGAAQALTAVNVPPAESELTPIDPSELLLGVRASAPGTVAPAAPPTAAELERRQNPWRLVLLIVVIALLGETFLATRGWRAIAKRTRPAPPEATASNQSTR